jgi:hypothetical protein
MCNRVDTLLDKVLTLNSGTIDSDVFYKMAFFRFGLITSSISKGVQILVMF